MQNQHNYMKYPGHKNMIEKKELKLSKIKSKQDLNC